MSKNEITTDFDYSQLATEDAQKLRHFAGTIMRQKKAHAEVVIKQGLDFCDARELLSAYKLGTFEHWCESECGYSRRTVYNYMLAYEEFFDCANFAQIEPSAMYLLGANPVAKEAALKLAAKGERITHKIAKALKAKHEPPKQNASPATDATQSSRELGETPGAAANNPASATHTSEGVSGESRATCDEATSRPQEGGGIDSNGGGGGGTAAAEAPAAGEVTDTVSALCPNCGAADFGGTCRECKYTDKVWRIDAGEAVPDIRTVDEVRNTPRPLDDDAPPEPSPKATDAVTFAWDAYQALNPTQKATFRAKLAVEDLESPQKS